MAKQLTSKQKKEQLNGLFAQYNKRLGRLYSDYVKKLSSLGYGEDVLESNALFNFDNFPELKARLNDIFTQYFQGSVLCCKQGITDGIALAFSHDTNTLGGFSILSDKAIRTARDTAAATFIQSRFKSAKGLNLAQTIWNYCQQTKSEFEMAMSNVIADGIKVGTSAETIGLRIRQYLKNPDMMYRRYHTVKTLANGTKKDVVTWYRKRIIDGKVRFVEEPLEKVGRGVYRSSRMNALRVARTEINAAYLRAHNERWCKEPFVIGQWIHVSPQHPVEDICDELEGRYPKDFVFSNWHPQCLCTSDPILIEGDEKKKFYDRLYAGEDMSGYVSPHAVTDVPDQYRKYIEGNEDAIMGTFRRDKLAWHLVDNKKYWQRFMSPESQKEMGVTTSFTHEEIIKRAAAIRHAKRDSERIQRQWTLRRSTHYMGRMKDVIAGLTYSNKNDLIGDALTARYNAVLAALKNPATRSVANVENIYRRFVEGAAIRERWDKLVWDGFSKEQIANCREIEKILGIKKGRPMSYEYADNGRENPLYHKEKQYKVNCQTCTVTHELRRRGFNITAKGKYEGFNTIDEKIMKWQHRFLAEDGTKETMTYSNVWKFRHHYSRMTLARKEEFILENLTNEGRYEIYCAWKDGGAHVFCAEVKNGRTNWFDPQNGRSGQYVKDYIKNMDGPFISVKRIDNKLVNPEMCKALNAKGTNAAGRNAYTIKDSDAPGNFFTDVRSAKSAKQKADLMQAYIDDASNHFTKIGRYSSKEGSIYSSYADQYDKVFTKGEMPKNLDMARKLTKKGYDVYMMPNPSESNSFDFIIKKQGKIYDIEGKAFNGKSTLDKSLDKGARQANRVLIDVIGNTNTNYISGNIKSAFEQNGLLSEIWLLKGSRLIKVRRSDYLQNEFIKKFRRIWENK